MSDEKKLMKLKNEMQILEKKEMRLTGTLEALFKALKKDLNDPDMMEDEVVKETRKRIKELIKQREKANKQFKEKMGIIETMSDSVEI